jgi:hypothetical protein
VRVWQSVLFKHTTGHWYSFILTILSHVIMAKGVNVICRITLKMLSLIVHSSSHVGFDWERPHEPICLCNSYLVSVVDMEDIRWNTVPTNKNKHYSLKIKLPPAPERVLREQALSQATAETWVAQQLFFPEGVKATSCGDCQLRMIQVFNRVGGKILSAGQGLLTIRGSTALLQVVLSQHNCNVCDVKFDTVRFWVDS